MAAKWLNYHHLYYFRTIAHEGGIAKAAQKLRLGQPTLSTQLRQLEGALNHRVLPDVKEEFWLISAARKIENPIAARIMKSFQLATK